MNTACFSDGVNHAKNQQIFHSPFWREVSALISPMSR